MSNTTPNNPGPYVSFQQTSDFIAVSLYQRKDYLGSPLVYKRVYPANRLERFLGITTEKKLLNVANRILREYRQRQESLISKDQLSLMEKIVNQEEI